MLELWEMPSTPSYKQFYFKQFSLARVHFSLFYSTHRLGPIRCYHSVPEWISVLMARQDDEMMIVSLFHINLLICSICSLNTSLSWKCL